MQSVRPSTRVFHRKGFIGAWLISSAVIAWGLACLPILAGTSAASVIVAPSYPPVLPARTTSNSALKGDRIKTMAPLSFSVRFGVQPLHVEPPHASKTDRKIPVGCEAAFSKLVANGNFSARCVT